MICRVGIVMLDKMPLSLGTVRFCHVKVCLGSVRSGLVVCCSVRVVFGTAQCGRV